MNRISTIRKALTAAALSGLGVLSTQLGDGITREELAGALIAAAIAGLGTWAVPNSDPTGEHQDESVQPAPGRPVAFPHEPDPRPPAA